MKTDFLRREEGQVLVQVTVSLVVLLIFVGLAIDGGLVYGERRRMQNAADAAALAGAYELCRLSTVDVARVKAIEYLKKNGVPDATAIAANIAISGAMVTATAKKTTNTYLSSFAGFSTIDIGAEAVAACGAATSACGLWPIGFELGMWQDDLACDELFVVWDSDGDTQNDKASCRINNQDHPLCDCYECKDDKGNSFQVVTGTSRGWLDYSNLIVPPFTDNCQGAGGGTKELKCRFEQNSAAKITQAACVPGLQGTRAGVEGSVDSRVNDAVNIALFDTLNCQKGESYQIAKFGCITVKGWIKNLELQKKSDPAIDDKLPKKIKSNVIMAIKNCNDGACTTACGSTDGTVPQPWEVTATSLIK